MIRRVSPWRIGKGSPLNRCHGPFGPSKRRPRKKSFEIKHWFFFLSSDKREQRWRVISQTEQAASIASDDQVEERGRLVWIKWACHVYGCECPGDRQGFSRSRMKQVLNQRAESFEWQWALRRVGDIAWGSVEWGLTGLSKTWHPSNCTSHPSWMCQRMIDSDDLLWFCSIWQLEHWCRRQSWFVSSVLARPPDRSPNGPGHVWGWKASR